MAGTIVQVSVGAGGVPKLPVREIRLSYGRVVGDDWSWSMYKMQGNGEPGGHGGPERAVCLFSLESLDDLKQLDYQVFPGALGENITTRDLDYADVRIGDRFQIGSEGAGPIILITRPRQPCKTIGTAYRSSRDPGGLVARLWDKEMKDNNPISVKWGKSGFYAAILREGIVCPSDVICKVS